MSTRAWRRVRQVTQGTALLLFCALFIYGNAQRPGRFWADLFSRLDPLAMIAASLAGRVAQAGLLLAGLTLLLTLLFGRAWCGWLCPLGTVLEWLGPRRARSNRPPETWRRAKVLLLVALLGAALLGNLSLLALDPIAILNRTAATAAWPALRYAVRAAEAFLYRFSALWGLLDAVHRAVVQPLFLTTQPAFPLAPLVTLFFAGLVGLNWWAPRFWCRYLCPLGGLLGGLARLALLRREVGNGCTQCGRCSRPCPTGTIDPADGYRSDPAECIICLDCVADCPGEGASFRWHLPRWRPARGQAPDRRRGRAPARRRGRAYDPSRRQVLAALGAAAAGAALAGVEPIGTGRPGRVIRPPGADRTDFSGLCIRCGACLRVCPTQGLQPSLFEGGLENIMTPRLVPRLGDCAFGCTACGQVCPTGAIPRLALEDKQRTVIGLAAVDPGRCLPWAYGTPCIVCEEACPLPQKAIQLEEVEAASGPLQRPHVVRERCIGCGTCEARCPVGGQAAIRVYPPPRAGGAPPA